MEPEKVVYSISTSFRRRPESIDIKMLEIPDQARNDRQKSFYDAIQMLSAIIADQVLSTIVKIPFWLSDG